MDGGANVGRATARWISSFGDSGAAPWSHWNCCPGKLDIYKIGAELKLKSLNNFFGVIFRSMNLGANLMSLTYYSMSLSDFHHEIDIWTCNCQISGGKWDVGGLIQPTSD